MCLEANIREISTRALESLTNLMLKENMLQSHVQLPKHATINTYELMFPTLSSKYIDEFMEQSDQLEMFLGIYIQIC